MSFSAILFIYLLVCYPVFWILYGKQIDELLDSVISAYPQMASHPIFRVACYLGLMLTIPFQFPRLIYRKLKKLFK